MDPNIRRADIRAMAANRQFMAAIRDNKQRTAQNIAISVLKEEKRAHVVMDYFLMKGQK